MWDNVAREFNKLELRVTQEQIGGEKSTKSEKCTGACNMCRMSCVVCHVSCVLCRRLFKMGISVKPN